MWSLPEMENPIGSVVIEILSFRQKPLLLYIIGSGFPKRQRDRPRTSFYHRNANDIIF